MIGNIYIIATCYDLLVVREHPDDPETMLVVPVMHVEREPGMGDVQIRCQYNTQHLAICSHSLFVKKRYLNGLRLDCVSNPHDLERVHKSMNAIATGNTYEDETLGPIEVPKFLARATRDNLKERGKSITKWYRMFYHFVDVSDDSYS